MALHKPFMVDESGNSIIHDFRPLRDFFLEVAPNTNSTVPPVDVQQEIAAFEKEARQSSAPFWNIGDDHYYWFIHRHWLGKGHTHLYNLSKFYRSASENAVAVFPRSKGAKVSHNNGEEWDYTRLVELLKPYFDKVYVVGHPSQSIAVPPSEKVELRITADNARILQACANSRLIITQHSGVNNLGEYLNRQVLIIYKGGKSVSDIGSMNNTLLFRKYLGEKLPLAFAFSEEEVVKYVSTHT